MQAFDMQAFEEEFEGAFEPPTIQDFIARHFQGRQFQRKHKKFLGGAEDCTRYLQAKFLGDPADLAPPAGFQEVHAARGKRGKDRAWICDAESTSIVYCVAISTLQFAMFADRMRFDNHKGMLSIGIPDTF